MFKEYISLTQLYTLMVNFLLGSSIVVGLAKEAKQDGWIAITIATPIGMGIVLFYYLLVKNFPGKNLFEVMEFCFSRWISIVISIIYIIYFFYIGTRVLRTFAEMIGAAIMPFTPKEMIIATCILLLAYILYLGLEVVGRIAEIFSPYLMVFFTFLAVFLPISGSVEVKHLFPILGEGIKPVVKVIFPSLLVFPFGELIVFTIIFSSIRELKKGKKTALLAVLSAGILFIFGSLLMSFTLGNDVYANSNFPLLSTARLLSVGEFIERIDPIVVFIMTLGVIIKCALFFYCGFKGLEYVFLLPYHYFVLPISILIIFLTTLIAYNFGDHLVKGGYKLVTYFHINMEFVIPSILLIFLMIKNKKVKNTNQIDN